MDNVLNRPLFRHREARDRLNESVGVQRFQEGGIVSGAGNPDFGGGSRAPVNMTADPSGAITRQYRQQNIRPVGLASLPSSSAAENLYNLRGFQLANNELLAAEDEVKLMQERFADDPTGENQQAYLDALADLEAQRQRTEAVRESFVPGPLGPISDTRGTLAVEGPEAMVSQMSPEQLDIFNNLDRAAEKPAPDVVPRGPSGMETEARDRGLVSPRPLGPSGMEMEARGRGVRDEAPAGRSTMEADARDRGPLVTNPLEVAAGLNAPEPEVREKTAADFMQEFMTNAPKYEGADKNLMLAQIGFAIAAGDSPDAMQNIANGLLAGSDMMLKDKASKDEFDRQLQLSAMQYGLQETAKERERGRQGLPFVAMQDTTYKGRPVQKGQQVYIPYSEIERNGGMAPAGFGDTALVEALSTKQQGMLEAMQKAYEQGLVDDTFVDSQTKLYSDSVRNAASAQRGLEYVEQAMLTVADGNVTGLKGSFNTLVSQAAAAAGLEDIAGQYNDRNEFIALMEKGFQNLIPSALSGVQSANSISNRDIELLAKAYADAAMKDGVFSLAFVTEDKLLNSLKGAVDVMQTGRQQSLADMSAVERKLAGRTLRSGTMGSPVSALTVLEPYQELIPERAGGSTPSQFGNLSFGEDGVYNIIYPES